MYLQSIKSNDTGYVIIENLINENDIDYILNLWRQKRYSEIKHFFKNSNEITKVLPDNYSLIDYTYIIEDSAIHTYHRDYTSSKRFNNLKYPSYTMILYLDESKTGLNVIPGSHIESIPIYLIDKSIQLNFKPGTAIMFDADLLHAGSIIDNTIKRHCIQFKIVHKDDVQFLPHLLNYHVLINKPNNKSLHSKYIESTLTKHFPIIMDLTHNTIKSSFTENKTPIQKVFSQVIFSNQDFYEPLRI